MSDTPPTFRQRIDAYLRRAGWERHDDRGPMPIYTKGAEEGLYLAEAVMAQCAAEETPAKRPPGGHVPPSQRPRRRTP